jgi:hypothetical protein
VPAASGALTPLTQRARELYESSVVPVREIAQLVGVSERTIYKYVRKGGWAPRVVRHGRGGAPGNIVARGAGGRFLALADAGRAHPQGLKALDPDGGRRAAAACGRAGEVAARAQAAAQAAARAAARAERQVRSYEVLLATLVDVARLELAAGGQLAPRARRLMLRLHGAADTLLRRVCDFGPADFPSRAPE